MFVSFLCSWKIDEKSSKLPNQTTFSYCDGGKMHEEMMNILTYLINNEKRFQMLQSFLTHFNFKFVFSEREKWEYFLAKMMKNTLKIEKHEKPSAACVTVKQRKLIN